jgi:parvulin-like peptidyl-prolyl isomerase
MKKVKKIVDDKLKKRQEPERLGDEKVPRITNKTVTDHREEVLSGARKFIYPLQHPKRYIVAFTTVLVILAVAGFFTWTTLALYRYQTTSNFMYRVTQVIPFPIARTGNTFIAYENYLFELRHYIHYYENQQGIDFDTEVGAQQLDEFRRRALEKVINDAYIRILAEENGISVSQQEIDEKIALVQRQDRLGNSMETLENVLREFWDWSVDDFRRSLEQQLLAQKVIAELDEETTQQANSALAAIEGGESFEEVAEEYSDDPATADQGGEFGFEITRTSRDIAPRTVDVLFSLDEGEISDIINVGYALQIVRLLERDGEEVRAAHMLFTFEDIETYINELKDEQPVRVYLQLPEPEDFDEPPLDELGTPADE